MEAMVNNGIFARYKVGNDVTMSISHLQFVDDTIIMGTKCWANIRVMCVVLRLFAAMSGLKVNFHKSMLVGVNVSSSWLNEAAVILNCRVDCMPYMYLGLPIEVDAHRLKFWEPLIDYIKSRLTSWKSIFLSFGGRLVLLKHVLTSLHVYDLSFFKAPSSIIFSIESILNLLSFVCVCGGGILGKFLVLIGNPFV